MRQTHIVRRAGRGAGALAAALLVAACARDVATQTPTADSRNTLASEAVESGEATPIASPYGDYLAGQFANRHRDLSAAADYMARALKDDPNNPALLHQTFLLMAGEGRMDEARRLAERLLELDGSHGPATLLMALERVRDGRYDKAAMLLDNLPQRGLSALVAPLAAGWIDVARGDLQAGLTRVKDLDAVDGFGVLRQVHTALMNDVAGHTEAAQTAYAAAAEQSGQLSLRLTWLIGNFFERQGERDQAAALYRRYMAEHPDSAVMEVVLQRAETAASRPAAMVETAEHGIAEALFNLGGLLSNEGANDIALVYTRMALHLRPDFETGRILLGEILQSQSRSREAVEVYREVPESSPFHYVAQLRIADELQRLGRDEAAADLLKATATAYPERYEPLYRLGNLLRSNERFDEAAAAYDRAIERVGEPANRHWTLYYFRGITLERTEHWAEAEQHFLQALELEPEQPYVMNYLAYSWVEQETNLERAQEMLRRAVELRPEDGYIVDSLGWVYYRLGKYDRAVKQLERAVELRPQDAVINDHLGDAYWKVGRRQEARFQWQRALSLEPEPDVMRTIEVKLEGGLEAAGSNG